MKYTPNADKVALEDALEVALEVALEIALEVARKKNGLV